MLNPTSEAELQCLLNTGLEQLGLNHDVAPTLIHYLQLLARWNKVYNLTAVREPKDMVSRHVLDSLAVQPWLQGTNILDVGSGAGLPGIPLAVLNPARQFCLLDSNSKKTRFLAQIKIELALTNVTIVTGRIEHYQPQLRYDSVLSRAFASLADFIALAGPFCATNGRLLALKGSYPTAELTILPGGYQVVAVQNLQVPGLDAERHLVHVAPAK
jgi:16S rRNA (guanine527-N7)-methyltransferase